MKSIISIPVLKWCLILSNPKRWKIKSSSGAIWAPNVCTDEISVLFGVLTILPVRHLNTDIALKFPFYILSDCPGRATCFSYMPSHYLLHFTSCYQTQQRILTKTLMIPLHRHSWAPMIQCIRISIVCEYFWNMKAAEETWKTKWEEQRRKDCGKSGR